MNARVSQFPATVRGKLTLLRQQRFFSDRLTWWILTPTILLNALTLVLLLIKLRPTDYPVPVHYSSLTNFDAVGPWYQIYGIGLFALVVTIVNGLLAMICFERSRITSFFLMIGAFVVALFCLVISGAFATVA